MIIHLKACVALAFSFALAVGATVYANAAEIEEFDAIFRHGLVVDGSGEEPYVGTVAVRDGRLSVLKGDAPNWIAGMDTDAAGKVIAPGFIDLHTHARADLMDPQGSAMTNYLTQGVTTVVIGNDGDGAVDITRRFTDIQEHGAGTNVVQYIGHGALRRAVMSRTDRAATEAEIATMQGLLESALQQGAAGLSSGLFYADGSFATTQEVIELCKTVARYGGVYDSHIRAESSRGVGVLAAIDEAIRIGRESGAAVHIAHIKVLGRDVWGKAQEVVAKIQAARDQGLRITADQYPWIASSTQLKSAVLSKEWQAGGSQVWRARLRDPATRTLMLEDMRINIDRRGGPESFLLLETGDARWKGLRLAEVAAIRGEPPEVAAAHLLDAGTVRVVSFNMQEEDIGVFMRQPWVATSSDGTNGHPRKFGSFPRKYHRYVRELNLIPVEQFVRSSSGLSADILGLKDRGYLRNGYIADLLVFDPNLFRERASFQEWNRLSAGVDYLMLAGNLVIDKGTLTGLRKGKSLGPCPGSCSVVGSNGISK
ncbi:D-aminoacylase (N-acyl-D-amino-acid deacylase) [gamma proteobacterium NOR5-3]|nr:D-aminoacylase (N-acyl-D-amino-acid deacylase) [gamma proteobacterium NOR5-3]